MALRFIEGFDHYGGDKLQVARKWSYQSGLGALSAGGRNGPYKYRTSGYPSLYMQLDQQPTWYVGRALLQNSYAGDMSRRFIELVDSSASQIQLAVKMNANGQFEVTRGTTVISTTTQTWQPGQWLYIEFGATIHPTAGSYELRVQGQTVLSDSGIDTAPSGNSWADRVAFGGNGDTFADDIYICDGSGTIRNSFLGDVRVLTVAANGAGAYSQFTPTGAASNWECVDESPADDDTTYVSANTAGAKDSYAMGDVSVAGPILGVQVVACQRKDDAGSRVSRILLRTGAADYVGANYSLSDSYMYDRALWQQNPGTSADWTQAEVNALEAGLEVVT